MSESSDSSRSGRSSGSSRGTPMSTIETSVTRLLVSTKHLLESLTQWARQEADDKFVSDAYVKLGNDFRAAARSFTTAGVDISDLGDVPKALRIVLESALSEAPTQANLDKFLPNIRSIIVTLLSNLKAKQARAKELAAEVNPPQPTGSTAAGHSNSVSNKNARDSSTSFTSPSAPPQRANGRNSNTHAVEKDRQDERPRRSKLLTELSLKANVDKLSESTPEPLPRRDSRSVQPHEQASASSDALAKLQKGNVISRRASKRFSAYQFAKLTNFGGSNVPRLSAELTVPQQNDQPIEEPREVAVSAPEERSSQEQKPEQAYVYLRIGDKTKKADAHFPMTMASLRLLFVEKFAYSPKTASFPEIYVLDPTSNISFELEEHRVGDEVSSGTLVLLKAPSHQEESLRDLELSITGLNSRMNSLASDVVTQVREVIQSAPVSASVPPPPKIEVTENSGNDSSKELKERNIMLTNALQGLQKELKSIKESMNSRNGRMSQSAAAMVEEITTLKEACLAESSPVNHRSFMEESYSKLSEDSDSLLTRVDDLQDMMEALRKDVAQRGVRLGAKQLKSTQKEISEAKQQLSGLVDYIRDGKPSWKKIWEAELDKVCEEQQFFNLQDDLTRDLDEDIRKIEETFELIEKCSVHQSKQNSKKNLFASRMVLPEPGESVHNLRDAVLSEVCALKPDHEGRLDAIAKAERLREKERQLESLNQFQEELGDFVDEKKLKSSGGIEELERRRKEQDAENLKSSFGIV